MISLPRVGLAALVAVGVCLGATAPAATKTTAPSAKSKKKRYRSSIGKPAPKTAAAMKKAPVKTAAQESRDDVRRSSPRPPTPKVSAATRMEANRGSVSKSLHRRDHPGRKRRNADSFLRTALPASEGRYPGPLRILHYGDSHTAADEWTGDLRTRFQEKFGDGGSGYSLIGRPYAGYRRFDVRSGSTKGWHTEGLVGKAPGDGIYGLGGISMSTRSPRESVYLLADGQQFELFYLQQPGGGAIQIYDNGTPVERISTDGIPRTRLLSLRSRSRPA